MDFPAMRSTLASLLHARNKDESSPWLEVGEAMLSLHVLRCLGSVERCKTCRRWTRVVWLNTRKRCHDCQQQFLQERR